MKVLRRVFECVCPSAVAGRGDLFKYKARSNRKALLVYGVGVPILSTLRSLV